MHLIGREQICQWKTLTKRLMKCPPELTLGRSVRCPWPLDTQRLWGSRVSWAMCWCSPTPSAPRLMTPPQLGCLWLTERERTREWRMNRRTTWLTDKESKQILFLKLSVNCFKDWFEEPPCCDRQNEEEPENEGWMSGLHDELKIKKAIAIKNKNKSLNCLWRTVSKIDLRNLHAIIDRMRKNQRMKDEWMDYMMNWR